MWYNGLKASGLYVVSNDSLGQIGLDLDKNVLWPTLNRNIRSTNRAGGINGLGTPTVFVLY